MNIETLRKIAAEHSFTQKKHKSRQEFYLDSPYRADGRWISYNFVTDQISIGSPSVSKRTADANKANLLSAMNWVLKGKVVTSPKTRKPTKPTPVAKKRPTLNNRGVEQLMFALATTDDEFSLSEETRMRHEGMMLVLEPYINSH